MLERSNDLAYDTAIKFIQDHPEKVDAVWQENQVVQLNAGHGGVPLMIFQGEPFFGQDRFDIFFFRLRQSGLTKRWQPRAPFTTQPQRWPEYGGNHIRVEWNVRYWHLADEADVSI